MFTVEEPEESHCKAFIYEGFEGLTAIEVSTARATERTDKNYQLSNIRMHFLKGLQQFTDEITELLKEV